MRVLTELLQMSDTYARLVSFVFSREDWGVRSQIVAILMFGSMAAHSAEITLSGNIHDGISEIRKITLQGRIATGDARKLDSLVKDADSAVVILDSQGGDYREGLALAKLFEAKKIRTAVVDGGRCLSACAIAFLGGTAFGEEGSEPTARSIGQTGQLGFHAPFIEISQAPLTPERVEDAYDHAIKTVTDFVRAAQGLSVSAEVAADMMTPQRRNLFFVDTVRELKRVGVQVQGISPPPALTSSMARNLCLNGWAWRWNETFDDAEAQMVSMLRDLNWDTFESTFTIKTTYFSPDPLDVKRTVFPIAEAGEGTGYYACVIDHVRLESKLHVSNRGYLMGENAEDILKLAHNYSIVEYQSPDVFPEMATGVEPLNRRASTIDATWALVPETTPITEINKLISHYVNTEPAL